MSTPVAAIRTEEIAFNGTETKPCFLIKGELSNAGVSSADDHAPNRRAEQLGEPCFNHLLTNSAALQRRITATGFSSTSSQLRTEANVRFTSSFFNAGRRTSD